MAKKKEPTHAPRKKAQRQQIRVLPTKRRKSRDRRSTPKKKQRSIPSPVRKLDKDARTRLKHALDLVRRHIKGYSTQDGWNMRALGGISKSRRGTLLKKAATLKTLLRQPHALVKAPTRKARKNLYQFTRQKLRKAKHFIVHKPADNFDVHLRDGRVVIRGTFEGKVRGKRRSKVITETAFYLFPHTARDPDDAERMLRDMLDEMPEGFYVVLTGMHGDTGTPVEKGALLARLRDYINRYQEDSVAIYDRAGNFVERRTQDSGFLQAITGFRFLSTSVDGMELQMQARDIRRQRGEIFNQQRRLELMTEKERVAYEAPRKAAAQRQAKRKTGQKAAATRRAKAKKARARSVTRKHK